MKRTSASATSGLVAVMALAALTATISASAMAEDKGWYGGLNIGRSKAKIDDVRIASGLLTGGFASVQISDDNRDLG